MAEEMTTTNRHAQDSASLGRMALWGVGAFVALLVAGTVALWFTVGTAVFYEVVAAGIAYCF
jgi:hypothetical protein